MFLILERSRPSRRGVNCFKKAAVGLEGEIKDEDPSLPAVAHRRGRWYRADGGGRSRECSRSHRAPT